jgi:hypothetical protein
MHFFYNDLKNFTTKTQKCTVTFEKILSTKDVVQWMNENCDCRWSFHLLSNILLPTSQRNLVQIEILKDGE